MGFLDKVKGTAKQAVTPGAVEGGQVVVKIDPNDPQALLVWGVAN
jgi:hypothetical protein